MHSPHHTALSPEGCVTSPPMSASIASVVKATIRMNMYFGRNGLSDRTDAETLFLEGCSESGNFWAPWMRFIRWNTAACSHYRRLNQASPTLLLGRGHRFRLLEPFPVGQQLDRRSGHRPDEGTQSSSRVSSPTGSERSGAWPAPVDCRVVEDSRDLLHGSKPGHPADPVVWSRACLQQAYVVSPKSCHEKIHLECASDDGGRFVEAAPKRTSRPRLGTCGFAVSP